MSERTCSNCKRRRGDQCPLHGIPADDRFLHRYGEPCDDWWPMPGPGSSAWLERQLRRCLDHLAAYRQVYGELRFEGVSARELQDEIRRELP